ncbi:hypothetical protein [Azospirillum largimobile]
MLRHGLLQLSFVKNANALANAMRTQQHEGFDSTGCASHLHHSKRQIGSDSFAPIKPEHCTPGARTSHPATPYFPPRIAAHVTPCPRSFHPVIAIRSRIGAASKVGGTEELCTYGTGNEVPAVLSAARSADDGISSMSTRPARCSAPPSPWRAWTMTRGCARTGRRWRRRPRSPHASRRRGDAVPLRLRRGTAAPWARRRAGRCRRPATRPPRCLRPRAS